VVNRISEAEQERVGLLCEEMGEAQQIAGKILRHGLDSSHPEMPLLSNANLLELEAGHVLAALDLLVEAGTISRAGLERERVAKLQKLRSWLHCGTNLDAVDELLQALEPRRYLLRSSGKDFVSVARSMIDAARADFKLRAHELLVEADEEAKIHALSLEKAVGEVSADDALEALRRYLSERRFSAPEDEVVVEANPVTRDIR
jgi:hypothetical protein